MATPYWTQAGDHTWGLVVEGRVVALVYWTGSRVGELDEPGGEPVVMDPGWFWFSVEDPDNHYAFAEDIEITGDMPYEQQVTATEDVLARASREILGEEEDR
jgi:hypothetical protein